MHRPLILTTLGALQFAAFGAGCVVLLGERTLDGELTAGDVAVAVGVALVGAFVVGSTWSGGRPGWWFQLVLGVGALAWGVVSTVADEAPGVAVFAAGVLWLAGLLLPQSRAWFLRDLE